MHDCIYPTPIPSHPSLLLKLVVVIVDSMQADVHTVMSIAGQCVLNEVGEPVMVTSLPELLSVHIPTEQGQQNCVGVLQE